MEQILARYDNKEDIIELIDGEIYYTVETEEYMTPWFKRCLKLVFPSIEFGTTMNIDIDLMFKIVDVYLWTR